MLNYKITHKYNEISLPKDVERELIDRVAWIKEPTFVTQGRTAWYVFEKPIEIEFNGERYTIKSVKMKGVGVYNPEGRHAEINTKPMPPTSEVYKRDEPHFGFDVDGKIIKIHSADAPYGGICHHRALMEYENAKLLFEANIPSIIPYMVVIYDDLFFEGSQMGAVLTLCTEEMPYRFLHLGWENKYIDSDLLDYYDDVKERYGVKGSIRDIETKLLVSQHIARQAGSTVRRLTECGLYIHSGGWENIQFDMDKGTVVLTDLDSTRKLENVSDKLRAITALRDFISNLYRYINKIYYKRAIKEYNPSILYQYDILFELIKGYLPEINDEEAKDISTKIWNFFMPYFITMKKNKDVLDDIPKRLRKTFKMDTDMFYILCLLLLYPNFLKTNSATITNDSLTAKEFDNIAKEYLGDNYAYIEKYL